MNERPFNIEPGLMRDLRQSVRSRKVLVARARKIDTSVTKATSGDKEPVCGIAIQDISRSGLSFLTNHAFNLGDMIELDVVCDNRRLVINGMVRYCRPHRGTPGVRSVGVMLLKLPGMSVPGDAFDAWVRQHSTEVNS